MPTSDSDLDERRWWLLRFAPRHDSGILYQTGSESLVTVASLAAVVPFLVSTGDYAPADMQYRMHRSLLWRPQAGLWGESYDVELDEWVDDSATASGNGAVAEAMARALHTGGDGTPAEMRGRWQRETAALIQTLGAMELDDDSALLLSRAVQLGTADGWLTAPKL